MKGVIKMYMLKKRLNNPWIKDVDTRGVRGLQDACYSWCLDLCGYICALHCELYCGIIPHADRWSSEFGSDYNTKPFS